MQHLSTRMALAMPLALLLGAAPAIAQQAAPAPESDPTGVEQANQTRELESEIEQYPAASQGRRNPADPATRIPEEVETGPSKSSQRATGTGRASSTAQRSSNAAAAPTSAAPASAAPASATIDRSEVQRVFGTDARLIALDSLDAGTITRMQTRLRELGHYRGPVDGIAGPQTRAALGAYARAQLSLKQRLIQQNQLTTDMAEQLGVEPSTRQTMPRSLPDMGSDPAPQRGDSSLSPRGAAPLPEPGMPLPTPSSAPPARGMPPAPGATPATPPPLP